MGNLPKPIIQIAGIKNQYEADLIMAEGANYLGFPLRLDVNEPDLTEEETARIIHSLPANINSVLITYEDDICEIIKMIEYLGVNVIQFHGSVATKTLKILRRFKENIGIIKSLIAKEDNLFELKNTIDEYQPFVDAFIIDSYDPVTGACGATGKTNDWVMAKKIVLHADKPVILAGGLNPANITPALRAVCPGGVDCHTGVEDENGDKNRLKLRIFVHRAKEAFGISTEA